MQDQTERRASYVKPAAALQDSVVTLVRNSVSIFPEHHEPLTTPTALLDIWKPEVINKLAHALFKCEWTPLQQELDSKGNFDKNAFHIQMIENLCLQHEHLHLKPLQHKLGRIMYEYYRHASLECTLPPDLHKRLVERFTESQSKPPNNLTVLYRCPRDQWGPALDTIAYYTMFERSPESTRAEHIIEEMSQELDNMARDEDSEELSPRIMQQMPQLIQAAQEEERPSFHETNLNRHWVSVRVKFEYVYRHYFGGYEQHHQVPFMVRREASHIFRHLVHLCIDFREFEYGWYWFERSFLKQDWNALLGVSELCKAASDHDSLWNARMWAVYATVIQMGHKQIAGSPDYPQFMYNVICLILVCCHCQKHVQFQRRARIFDKTGQGHAPAHKHAILSIFSRVLGSVGRVGLERA
ncbi:hypothetical protein EDD86DRAFT_75257 [Gorgonomyces haynaldii]|nr:hypothetical protein EDD86DRAFT_75257 [Gorgonomyces haynaldii]